MALILGIAHTSCTCTAYSDGLFIFLTPFGGVLALAINGIITNGRLRYTTHVSVKNVAFKTIEIGRIIFLIAMHVTSLFQNTYCLVQALRVLNFPLKMF